MSRPETQLREYFDAGVERISVDDVIAQSRVSEDTVRPLRWQRSLKPAWVAVGAFAVTIVGLGGLASVLKLTTDVTVDAGAGEIVDASGSMITVWLIAAAIAAAVAGLTVWLVQRAARSEEHEEEIESDQEKVTVMETIEKTDTQDETTQKTDQRSRWPIVVIAIMAIALVGLIAWMALMMRPNSSTAAPPEIQQLIEDYTAAFNAYDADAVEALVTDGYRIHSGTFDYDIDGVSEYLLPLLQSVDWHATNDGPYYAVEGLTGTWYVSSEGAVINRSGTDHPENGLFKVVDARAGGPLVVEHFFMGG